MFSEEFWCMGEEEGSTIAAERPSRHPAKTTHGVALLPIWAVVKYAEAKHAYPKPPNIKHAFMPTRLYMVPPKNANAAKA